MFKELINKLKGRKQKLENYTTYVEQEEKKEKDNIIVSEENGICKIDILDYISIGEYVKVTDLGGIYSILSSISNSVLWNSDKQKVNKGIFYVINVDNRLYNILINDEIIKIDERIQKEFDDERNKDNITEERIITFSINSKEYWYTSFRHDKTGDTYYTKYYGLKYDLGPLELSDNDAFSDIKMVFDNLLNIQNIENILDISLLNKYILEDLSVTITRNSK